MSDHRVPLGMNGEHIVADYLIRVGYTILATRWRCPFGEIDLIAAVDDEIVFVEVRTRHEETSDAAFESISKRKADRLIRLAQAFLDAQHLEESSYRIDVAAVTFRRGEPPAVEIIENAIGW